MKFSPFTISVLDNYAKLHPSLILRKNYISTIDGEQTNTQRKSVFAWYKLPDDENVFDANIGIYDLNTLLKIIREFSRKTEWNIDFDEDFLTVSSGPNKVKFWYSPEDIICPYVSETEIDNFKDFKVKFLLTESDLKQIHKFSGILCVNDFLVVAGKGKVAAKICSVADSTTNNYSVLLGENQIKNDEKISSVFCLSDLTFVQGDYIVELIPGLIAKFTNHDHPNLVYIVTMKR